MTEESGGAEAETQEPVTFKRMVESDLSLLAEWMGRPHVALVWGPMRTLQQVRERYLPRLDPSSLVVPYLASQGGSPIGFVQSYVVARVGNGWWPDERDPGARGIDFFLADADRLGQGLGVRMVGAFAEHLFRDLSVTTVQADPGPENARSIRCLEKAGFDRVGLIETPDGPAILMRLGRSGPSAADYAAEPVRYPPLEVLDLVAEGASMAEGYHNIVVNRVNSHCLRLAAFDGVYPWHHHPGSDEMFLVLEGCLLIDLADGRTLRLEPWQAATVPAGIVHRTRTEGRTVNLCFEELAADTVFVEAPTDENLKTALN